MPIDLLSLSAHKLHGPRASARSMCARASTSSRSSMAAAGTRPALGHRERGGHCRVRARRPRSRGWRWRTRRHGWCSLRDRLHRGDRWHVSPMPISSATAIERLPGHLCLGFAGQEGEAIKLLLALDEAGIAVSSGSACSAHHGSEPSYVLMALGIDPVRARGSLRLTLGRFNTAAEVERLPRCPAAAWSPSLRPISGGIPVPSPDCYSHLHKGRNHHDTATPHGQ